MANAKNPPAKTEAPPTAPVALLPATTALVEFDTFLSEMQRWLELPYVSPRAIAEVTRDADHTGDAGELFIFTLLAHAEQTFERQGPDGEPVGEPVHLWLCKAQTDISYFSAAGDLKEITRDEEFLISQKSGARVRDGIADRAAKILEEHGCIPNVTMAFTGLSAKAKAKGWSAAVTFRAVAPRTVEATA